MCHSLCLCTRPSTPFSLYMEWFPQCHGGRWKAGVHHPTLLVVPNTILNQMFQEAADRFENLLTIKVYYKARASCTQPSRRGHTIDRPELQAHIDKLYKASYEPEVSPAWQPSRHGSGHMPRGV